MGAASSNQTSWINTKPQSGSMLHPKALLEQLVLIKGYLIAQDIIRRFCQFVG